MEVLSYKSASSPALAKEKPTRKPMVHGAGDKQCDAAKGEGSRLTYVVEDT